MNYLYLVLAGILSGGIVFGGKVLSLCGATPFEIMLFPNLIGTLLMTPFIGRQLYKVLNFPWQVNLLFLSSVFFIIVGQYVPLFMNISVTLVLLLLYLQPVWTIMIERFYFRRKVPLLNWLMVGAMVAGLLLLINPFGGEVSYSLGGIALALLGGVGLSVWILSSQYYSEHGITPWASMWCTCFYAVLPVLVLYFGVNDYMLRHAEAPETLTFAMGEHLWIAFLIYSVFIYVPASVFVFLGNKGVSPAVIGMILLLEPVTGITLDVLFLHNPLTWNILTGGLIILAANIVLIIKNSGTAE